MKTNVLSLVTRFAFGLALIPLLPVCLFAADAKVPTDDAIKGELRGRIPRYLKVESVATELISQADSTVKMNFDAKLAPKEDLFVEDTATLDTRAVRDLPPAYVRQAPAVPKLLKATQKEGATGKVYGSFTAVWRMDHWTFQELTIDEGLTQFGRPLGAFGPGDVVGGTPAADAAQKTYNEAIATLKRTAEEAIAREKAEKIALAEKQKAEADKLRLEKAAKDKQLLQSLLDATAAGTMYEGVIDDSFQHRQQGLQIQFLEQNGLLVKCELVNPGNPAHRRLFTGVIHVPKTAEDFPLILGTENTPQGLTGGPWPLYTGSLEINFHLIENRLEGEARFLTWWYSIKVARKAAPAAKTPATTSSGVAPVVPAGTVAVPPVADNRLVVFSKPLPGLAYRPESPADFVEGYKKARQLGDDAVQAQTGNDPLGLGGLNKTLDGTRSKAESAAGQIYISKLRGLPLHYTAKFLKVSNFLGDHSIMLGIADDLTLTLKPKVGQKETMALLKPGDEVEFSGEFGSVDALLFRGVFGWTLTIPAAEIISIKRAKS